jgi:acetyl-CoA acetyltransferase
VREVDGFASYSMDRNDPPRIATALGSPDLSFSNMFWGGGGGGGSGAVANAAAALVAGYSKYVVVYRGLAQGQFGRFGQGSQAKTVSGGPAFTQPYGLMSPAQTFAMRVRRFMHDYGISHEPQKAIAMASYYHAQSNPRAVMHGRPLSEEDYENSRWIVEPFRLFDCCMENDGAAAVILTTSERARDLKQKPAYVMAASQGSDYRQAATAHNAPDYGTSNFKTVARRLYEQAGIGPKDVDVCQSYENFTGGVMMSLVEHGFCAPEEVEEFMTFDNFKVDGGRLPLNTSGGNLAECYMHGLELITEAVRQLRGTSTAQVKDAEISMVCSGPMVQPVSSLILRK